MTVYWLLKSGFHLIGLEIRFSLNLIVTIYTFEPLASLDVGTRSTPYNFDFSPLVLLGNSVVGCLSHKHLGSLGSGDLQSANFSSSLHLSIV